MGGSCGGIAAAVHRVQPAGPRKHGVGVREGRPLGARAALRHRGGDGEARVREMNPQDLANTAWAYTTAGHAALALLDAIAVDAARRVGEFNPHYLTITAWAYAAAHRPTDGLGLFGQLFARRCEELATELTIEHRRQLHQWALMHADERGRSDGLPNHALLERCRAAFGSEEGRPSQLQRRVGMALALLGLRPEEEVVLHEGYSLTLWWEWRGEPVGVEVDGSFHFIGHEPNGATQLKRRQLRHLSWRLMPVPYGVREWDEVGASSQRAKENLASRLGLRANGRTGGIGLL